MAAGIEPGELREALVSSGLCSKAPVEEQGECLLAYCDGDPPLLIAASRWMGWVYAKAVPEALVKPYMWSCSDVFYNPYGQYAFARSIGELAERLASKKRLLRAQLSLALERLEARGEG